VTDLETVAAEWSPRIVRISVTDGQREAGVGTGFITRHGIVTAGHVVLELPSGLRAQVDQGSHRWELATEELRGRVRMESPEQRHDYAVISTAGVAQPFSKGTVTVQPPVQPPVGRQVAYLGHPFGTTALVVSSGYVSSVETTPLGVIQMRVDGSVNRGNSGGPLIDLVTGELVAIVTRAATGFLVEQMNELKVALAQNVRVLQAAGGGVFMGGIDAIGALRASMSALLEVTEHIERSANVGIGYAFGTAELARVIALDDGAA
jgi:S1-C subfamily serine protease